MNLQIYQDMAKRTNSDIYAGVVGPVRTGKSTFIKKFMDILVIPNIENKFKKERAIDELPQSGSGKTIMTCEPKFVPSNAISINIDKDTSMNVRMIDCVGYIVKDALGIMDGESPRMISTPWSNEAMPFEKAAEIGTKKVIKEHSTIGIVVTTDGSITDIARENYVLAEERVVKELKEIGKPFAIILNSTHPNTLETQKLKGELCEKYASPVIPLNIMDMTLSDIEEILKQILYQFPVKEIIYSLPQWVNSLEKDHWLITQIFDFILSTSSVNDNINNIQEGINKNICENFTPKINNIDLSSGRIEANIDIDSQVFYRIVSEKNNVEIKNESELFLAVTDLIDIKRKYERLNQPLKAAYTTGYGVVAPEFNDYVLSEPEVTVHSSQYGIKIKAKAECLHIISTTIESEVSPTIGGEEECENFYNRIIEQYNTNPNQIWETEIFGRTLKDMMTDNMQSKLNTINDDTKQKFKRVLNRISNGKKGGVFIVWL